MYQILEKRRITFANIKSIINQQICYCDEMQISRDIKNKFMSVCSETMKKILRKKGRVEILVFSRKFSICRDHLAADTITQIF